MAISDFASSAFGSRELRNTPQPPGKRELRELLDRSSFDYLQVDVGHLKVTVGKGMPPVAGAPAAVLAAPAVALEAPPAAAPELKPAAANIAVRGDGVMDVKAPMIGRFYAQPEPGAYQPVLVHPSTRRSSGSRSIRSISR